MKIHWISINGNKGITDKSVPVLKEMLKSSHIKNTGYLLTSNIVYPFHSHSTISWGKTSISAEFIEELNQLMTMPIHQHGNGKRAKQEIDKKKIERRKEKQATQFWFKI